MTEDKQVPPHLETPWFEREEHKPVRKCTCHCGATYESQARSIIRVGEERNKKGELEEISWKDILSLRACPACMKHHPKTFS